jgi:hypothetical protein
MNPVELLLSKLPDAKRSGNGWIARCPAHDDRNPSLSISEGDDGRALVHCHAGCKPGAIVEAVGMKLADLMPEAPARPGAMNNGRATPKAQTKPPKAFPTATEAVAELERQHGPRADWWTYRDAGGEPVGVMVRWDTANGKDIRPVSKTDGGWIIGGMSEPRPLYRLPDLLSRRNEAVYVCEGEKAADAAAGLGLLATTSPHGSKSAGKTDWTPLAGRDVVILPDHDEAGARYADDVAGILAKLTRAATVRIVNLADAWPDMPEGGDMADVVEAGEEPESTKAKLKELVDKPKPEAQPLQAGPVLTCLADVEPRDVAWLWAGRVPLGRITLLVGQPGVGKSYLTCDMASRITTGTDWPDGSECPAGSVILITAEDDPADTIRPRLNAHKAEVSKVHLLSAVRRIGEDGQPCEVMFTLADVAALETALKRLSDCRLIVVDPIGSFLGGSTDSHRDNEVRGVLAPIAKLAEKHGPAVLLVAHRRKSAGSIADDLALGSRAFTGIARAVWHLSRDPQDKNRRLLLAGKNNLAPEGHGLAFTIKGFPAVVAWEHDPVTMSADDALAQENGIGGDDHKPGPEPEARNQAKAWLKGLLRAGRMEVSTIKAEAEAAGQAWRTVQRAKDELGIQAKRVEHGGKWWWELPANLAPTCHVRQHGPQEQKNLASWHDSKIPVENSGSEPGTIGTCQDDLSWHDGGQPGGGDWGNL